MISMYMALIDDEDEQIIFQKIYENYKKQMWYMANEILKDRYLAEDAVHDAFIGIAKNISKIKKLTPESMRAYVVISSRNSALNYIRKNKYGEVLDINELFYLKDEKAEKDMNDSELLDFAVAIIEAMPESYTEIMYLYFVAGLSEKEIAQQFDKSITSIRQKIYRGRKIFRNIVEKGGDNRDKNATE